MPVAARDPAMPPHPAARASVAAQIRRARSVNVGAKRFVLGPAEPDIHAPSLLTLP